MIVDITLTTSSGYPEHGMIGQRPEGRLSMGRSTVRNLLLRVKTSLFASLPMQGQPSSPDITLLSGHLLPVVTWSTLTTSIKRSSSLVMLHPHRDKLVPTRTSARLTERSLERRFAETLPPFQHFQGPPPPFVPLIQTVRRDMRRSSHKEGGFLHRPWF